MIGPSAAKANPAFFAIAAPCSGEPPGRKGLERSPLLAPEAGNRGHLRGAMHPRIGDRGEPVEHLRVQVCIRQKRAPVQEAVTQVADRPLDFALGLDAIRPADPGACPRAGVLVASGAASARSVQ